MDALTREPDTVNTVVGKDGMFRFAFRERWQAEFLHYGGNNEKEKSVAGAL